MAMDQYNIYNRNQKVSLEANIGSTGNSRDTDSRALAACACKLEDAKNALANDPKSKDALKNYGDAVRFNQRLWTIFQVSLTDPQNPLPEGLKITLFNLSRYVDKTSLRAVGKLAPREVDSLININRMIATGLSKKPEQAMPMHQQIETPTETTTRSVMTSA